MAFDFPRVSYGTPSFPVVTTPVTIHTPDEGADADETTGVIAAEALEPQRVQGALRYSREDAARFAALGDAVMRHVRAAYAAAVDGRCLTDTTAGLLSITEPADPGAEADFDDYIGVMIPDGRYSTNPSDVHLLVGNETAAHMAAEYKTNNSPTSAYAALLGLAGAGSMRVAHGRSWLTLWVKLHDLQVVNLPTRKGVDALHRLQRINHSLYPNLDSSGCHSILLGCHAAISTNSFRHGWQ